MRCLQIGSDWTRPAIWRDPLAPNHRHHRHRCRCCRTLIIPPSLSLLLLPATVTLCYRYHRPSRRPPPAASPVARRCRWATGLSMAAAAAGSRYQLTGSSRRRRAVEGSTVPPRHATIGGPGAASSGAVRTPDSGARAESVRAVRRRAVWGWGRSGVVGRRFGIKLKGCGFEILCCGSLGCGSYE